MVCHLQCSLRYSHRFHSYFAFNHLPLGTATFIFYGLFLITSYLVGWALPVRENHNRKSHFSFSRYRGIAIDFWFLLTLFFGWCDVLLAALNGIASGGEAKYEQKSTDRHSSLQLTFYSGYLS